MRRYLIPLAIALAVAIPQSVQAQTKTMVSVDRSILTEAQAAALDRVIPWLPRTQVGARCQFYGKPQIWCLLLDAQTAADVQRKLQAAGIPAETKPVNRIRNRGRS